MGTKIVILGAGPGGYTAAIRAAQLGADVTLIEKARVGGTCLNQGCIPSKIFKRTADLLDEFNRASEFCIETGTSSTCAMPSLLARKERIVTNQQNAILALLKAHNVTYVAGRGTILGPNAVQLTDETGRVSTLPWDRLILATGSRPRTLPALPFNRQTILASDDALALNHIPESITIFGGGVIGCEFACIFRSFGARVTLVEGRDRLLPLPSVDQSCSKILLREMKKRGITVLVNTTIESAAPAKEGVEITLAPSPFATDFGKKKNRPLYEHSRILLVCIGRAPNSDNLGLARIGVATDPEGWISADEMMRTAVPEVFAVGDILGPAKVMLAHVAAREGEIAAENSLGAQEKMSYATLPNAIFTTPEIGTIGLSEDEARRRYPDIRTDTVLYRATGKAHVIGEPVGEAKIISRAGSGRILGIHITGAQASDVIAEGVFAVTMKATVQDLATTIHAHPTLAEVLQEAALKAIDKPRHG